MMDVQNRVHVLESEARPRPVPSSRAARHRLSTGRDDLERLDPAVRAELEHAWAHSGSIRLAAADDLYSMRT
jgi:hypothetical protein